MLPTFLILLLLLTLLLFDLLSVLRLAALSTERPAGRTTMGGETSSRVMSSYPRLAKEPVGKQIESIYTDRLRQFTSGGQYEKQNLLS